MSDTPPAASGPDLPELDARLDAHAERALARLRAASEAHAAALLPPHAAERVQRVVAASEFAFEALLRHAALLERLVADDGAVAMPPPVLDPAQRAEWGTLLRRFRIAEGTRLVWRDVLGLDTLDETLAGTTRLAEQCLALAHDALEAEFTQRHGVVRDAQGAPVRLVVFALGKLGGGELNFSSDVDLVYAYECEGESDGPRPLAAEDLFARLGQQLARLLDEVTAEGFCHRVDLRLRPFGAAGRIALSFSAMEQYFQREGRDWERYAWQKARPVAGDLAAGERFLATLRPFVYRRYLDYGALDGLREMKATIAAEVARKDMADDIKRGPGGIREVEFLAQALQLIRGGREAPLRERQLQPALRALRDARHLEPEACEALLAAYRFLRLLENRLQMLRDAQTQQLPADAFDRHRVARGLGYAGWRDVEAALRTHRGHITREFEVLLAPRKRVAEPGVLAAYWRGLPEEGDASALAEAGIADAEAVDQALRDFARAPGVRDLSGAARARLDRLLPALLRALADGGQPLLALRRLLAVLHAILRRASYLALLDEQPAALARLIDVLGRSALLGERLAAHPLLLDELLDMRVAGPLPVRGECAVACAAALAQPDAESALLALNEVRQAFSFRIALATLDGRLGAEDSARQLAWLADAVLDVVHALARREVEAMHGDVPGLRFAAIGYGSLGGSELGFGSDLDVVFVYDAPEGAVSSGARAVDAGRWAARLAQKIVALLGAPTGAGRLYDIDVRLRPDGAKGLLVTTLASFEDYQRHRAWTWEHQALVRARAVTGDAGLCAEVEAVRARVLGSARDVERLREDVAAMRARMRAELDRSSGAGFDLKQGDGGLVDLEFLLQYLVLRDAGAHPSLAVPRDTPGLIDAAVAAGVLEANAGAALHAAHAALLAAGQACTLDRRARITATTDAIDAARDAVRAACQAHGLAA